MANGIINLTSNNSKLEGRIVWSSSSNGSSANTSNVYAELQVRRTDSYTTKGTWSGSLFIHDEQQDYSNSSTSVSSNWITMKSFTKYNVPHNDNGTGWCHIWGNVSAPSGTSMAGAYAEVDTWVELDTIPRYLTITSFKVQSKTINTAVISWATSDPRSSTHYSLNGGDWIGSSTDGESVSSDSKSGTFNIKNLSPNTTYKIKIKCTRADSGLETVSNEISFTTYDYAKLSSVPNVNIGSAHTITWTNPAGATTSLKLCKTDNNTIIDYGTVTGTSKSITPTASTIYALTPNSNTYTARYILTTTQNGVSYTNYKDFTFAVTNSNPIFTNYTYQDTNATTVALTGNNQILVKGYSNLKATISTANKAVAKNSATMKSYKLVSGSKSTSVNYSNTADVSLSVNNVDSGTIVLYATDSRGNSTPVTKTATYKEYTDLVIKSVTAERGSNGVGQDVTLKFNGTYWNNSFGNVNNAVTNVKYYYRETSSNDWIEGETELIYTAENGQFTGDVSIKGDLGANGFDVSKSFYIRLQVSDKLVTKTYDITLGSGTPAIAIYKNKVAIGGKYNSSVGGALQLPNNSFMLINTNAGARNVPSGGCGIASGGDGASETLGNMHLFSWYGISFGPSISGQPVNQGENAFWINCRTGDVKAKGKLGQATWTRNTSDTYIPVVSNGKLEYTQRKFASGATHTGWNTDQDFIPTMSFLSFWNGAYDSYCSSNLMYCYQGTIQAKPISLYSNSDGSNGTITLSQSAANFSYLEVYYAKGGSSNLMCSVKIDSPNGKTVALNWSQFLKTWAQIQIGHIKISGTSITRNSDDNGGVNLAGTGNSIFNVTELKIYKVLGYR